MNIKVIPIRDNSDWVRCPRCKKFHRAYLNYDKLCDICCDVLTRDFHSLTNESGDNISDLIAKSLIKQKLYYSL